MPDRDDPMTLTDWLVICVLCAVGLGGLLFALVAIAYFAMVGVAG